MWDEKDYLARWVQGIIGFLGLVGIFGLFYFMRGGIFFLLASLAGLWLLVKVCWRSFRYAMTGKGSPNRDGF